MITTFESCSDNMSDRHQTGWPWTLIGAYPYSAFANIAPTQTVITYMSVSQSS